MAASGLAMLDVYVLFSASAISASRAGWRVMKAYHQDVMLYVCNSSRAEESTL